jgi:hypothetical protein
MSTLRYSGEIRIRVTYLDPLWSGNGSYRCYLRGPGGMATTVIVNAPAFPAHALDAPEAFDDAARAAISCANDDDEREGLACYEWGALAATTANGWHVGRSEARAWPQG